MAYPIRAKMESGTEMLRDTDRRDEQNEGLKRPNLGLIVWSVESALTF
jgi:hypothetical protein